MRGDKKPTEDWIWANLPRWLASFISGLHDMMPFTDGEWSKNKYGDDR